MVIDIDAEGKIRLSRQAVLEGWTAEEAREHDRRRPSGGHSSRGNDRNRGGRSRGGRSRSR
jgi:polyribonucleotide nucleotidyltransferase